MIKVLTIGSDRNLFKKESQTRARVAKQGSIFKELHIVVFSLAKLGLKPEKIADNVWIYPTNSSSRFFYVRDATRIGRAIIHNSPVVEQSSLRGAVKFVAQDSVISAQDPFEAGLVASRLARAFALPLQIQIHTDFLSPFFRRSSFLNRLRVIISRCILPRADSIRVVSKRIADSLKESGLRLKAETVVLPVFADTNKISNGQPIFDLREKFPDFKSIILTVGRLSPEKNVSSALKVLAAVIKKYPQTGMVIVGDGPEKAKLMNIAKSLDLGKNVVFEQWQEELASYYKTANIFLLVSNYEGYGLVLLEAAASGCPIVTTDVGIAEEILKDNYKQFICPVGDEKCLAGKVLKLIEDNYMRRQYSTDLSLWAQNQKFPDLTQYLSQYKESMEDCLKKTTQK